MQNNNNDNDNRSFDLQKIKAEANYLHQMNRLDSIMQGGESLPARSVMEVIQIEYLKSDAYYYHKKK